MTGIPTYTGKQIHPLEPDEEKICIEDIAGGLSNKCRFNGQCDPFYSVAEHSIILSRLLPPKYKLGGLLHDAAEAYLPDVPIRIKPELKGFQEIEDNLLRVIITKFGLEGPMPEEVQKEDYILGLNEFVNLITSPLKGICHMHKDIDFMNRGRNVCYSEELDENFTVYEMFLTEFFLNSTYSTFY